MIVKVNQDNSDKYHKLFIDAYKFLKDIDANKYPEDRFNSLAEYYGHMADFIAQGERGYKYIMLPLDEEAFNIDLNTRTINVPAAFSKCASIQSDQLAETVLFVADRYFDYMDLATTEIYVQWETPEDKKNNIAAIKGATRVEMMDVESEPGKIKFAWPLNDIITAVPGIVKFSVRFCRLDGNDFNNLFYSLNTLESSFTIKPALAAAMPKDENKIEGPFGANLFANAIINSMYATDGVVPPTMAEFSAPGSDIFSNNGVSVVDGKKITHLNDDTVTLYAQAYTSDANSNVEYAWYYSKTIGDDAVYYNCLNYPTAESFDEDGNLLSIGEDEEGNEIPVIATNKEDPIYKAIVMGEVKQEDYLLCNPQPTERVAREVYYYITNSDEKDQVGYVPEYDEYILDTFSEDIPVYEKYTSFTIPATPEDEESAIITGSYKVAAWGIKKVTGKDDLKTPYPRNSSPCIIPVPNEIEFKTDLSKNKILEKTADATVELKVEVAEDPYRPDLTYSWKSSHSSPDSLEDLEEADEAVYEANDIGWYEATVESTLNRTPVSATSTVCKVTNPVTPPIVTSLNTDEIYVSTRATDVTNDPADGYEGVNVQQAVLRINADVVNATGYHKALYTDNIENGVIKSFKYVWQICPLNGTYSDVTNATPGVILDANNPNQITVTPRLKEQVSNFRCLVVNTLNEESSVFDHSGVGLKDSEIAALGAFKKEAPHIYSTPETQSFVFTVIRS